MDTHITRKRSRSKEDESALPPAKRETDPDNPESGAETPGGSTRQADHRTGDGHDIERDDEFWFDDGTVILVACDVEFRFYKGLLASVSPVFKQLFADSRVVRTVPMDEGQTFSCPVVHVSDSPEELRYVLRTCSSKRPDRLYEEREPSYQEISAAIRLGRKYKMTELYSQSVEFLQSYFPDALREHSATAWLLPPGWNDLDVIGVVNLARLTGELSFLPSALVACICAKSTGTNGIVHGYTREDGSSEHLSPDDLAICFNGKTSLRIATVGAIFRTFAPTVHSSCERPAGCRTALGDALFRIGRKPDFLLDGDPFPPLWAFGGNPGALGLCRHCLEMVVARSLKERKEVWERLPEILGIDVPGWRRELQAALPPPQPGGDAT